jgi:hypothetical protein
VHGASQTRSLHGFVNLPGDLRQSPETSLALILKRF